MTTLNASSPDKRFGDYRLTSSDGRE